MDFNKFFSWAHFGCFTTGITLIIVILLELCLTIFFQNKDRKIYESSIYNQKHKADTYSDRIGLEKLIEEDKLIGSQWEPYAYWRAAEFRGEYFNISKRGLRKTWNTIENTDEGSSQYRIFMFGGSTMFGRGSPDDMTIPSIVSKKLYEKGIIASVTNFGQLGYINTQELISLVREIESGNYPDIVIFYDGMNDVFSTYVEKRPGVPVMDRFLKYSHENRNHGRKVSIVEYFKNSTSIGRLAKIIGIYFTEKESRKEINIEDKWIQKEVFSLVRDNKQNKSDKELAKNLLAAYERNIKIIKSIADKFKFKVIFYWQPTIFEKNYLTEYEEKQKKIFSRMEGFHKAVYYTVRQSELPENYPEEFRNISLIFTNHKEPLFLDVVHTGPSANFHIAEKMVFDIINITTELK